MISPSYEHLQKQRTSMRNVGAFGPYDMFISAYNASDRVRCLYERINAKLKCCVAFPEYALTDQELPGVGDIYRVSEGSEDSQVMEIFDKFPVNQGGTIAIDITGFLRPQLAFLIKYLVINSIPNVDFYYVEPAQYSNKEHTVFSDGNVLGVRQVKGFQGIHTRDISQDLLIIGAGYDRHMIKNICNHKEHARRAQLVGMPSLRADMYQESMLAATLAQEELGEWALTHPAYAPAHDPFSTASVLSLWVGKESQRRSISNLYLSPLGTKPQVLGFVVYFLKELEGTSSSILLPFFERYGKGTSRGVGDVWVYRFESEFFA